MTPASLLRLHHSSGMLGGTVQLPASKSESNRALLIDALTGHACTLRNLSSANDTVLMQQLLKSNAPVLDAEDAGTAIRFLTAYFAITNRHRQLTGTTRMQQRPIGLLVEALRELGADIEYLGQEGYPPLQINGIDLSWPAQELTVAGHISSQFISALLLVAPMLPLGLRLHISGTISSRPYIDLTLAVMRAFGAAANWTAEHTIAIDPVPYEAAEYTIEADWSAAGYWYSMAALAGKAEIALPGLSATSAQPDKAVVNFMTAFGVETSFTRQGVLIRKVPAPLPGKLSFDFLYCPDLAPTLLALAAAKGVAMEVTGLASLRIKETDRIAALQTELQKLGARLISVADDKWTLQAAVSPLPDSVSIETYSDHRMAMAFAPLALLLPVTVQQPDVVRKSYPGFWQHLEQVGFLAEKGQP